MALDMLLFQGILDREDPTPGTCSNSQTFLNFLLLKNLADMFETGEALINELSSVGGLPDAGTLRKGRTMLNKLYSSNMFIEDSEYGLLPNWSNIKQWPEESARMAHQIYRICQKNIRNPEGISKCLRDKNKDYFLSNIDQVFSSSMFKDTIGEFKSFLASDKIPAESQEIIWDYFGSIIELFTQRDELIKILSQLPKDQHDN